jgi:hypothetical protein
MAYSDIKDPSTHFQATTYTGAGANTEVTNSGNSDLKPDFLWIKNRTAGYGHFVVDSNRNISYAQNSSNAPYLETESTAAENSNQNWMQSVNTDGFTTGISEHINNNSGSAYVAWQWKANGGTTSSNTDGTITSTVQANTDAGFNIVTYTGNGANSNFGHGMGEQPDMVIVKNRTSTNNWCVWHKDLTSSYYLQLNTEISQQSGPWDGLDPNSGVVFVYSGSLVNASGSDYVAYIFKSKQGYSKFGSYKGNSNANGPFVYTGFKPAWVMVKKINGTGGWVIMDNKRNAFNVVDKKLAADKTNAESTVSIFDFLSNGFKLRVSNSPQNQTGGTYIYMAFAENPFVAGGIPTTAR